MNVSITIQLNKFSFLIFCSVSKCKKFPACLFGDKCLYIHPNVRFSNFLISKIPCRFGTRCTRVNCSYSHPRIFPKFRRGRGFGRGSFKQYSTSLGLILFVKNSRRIMYQILTDNLKKDEMQILFEFIFLKCE